MAYFGYQNTLQNPLENERLSQRFKTPDPLDPSDFNSDSDFDVSGIAQNVNFQTTGKASDGFTTFPSQADEILVSSSYIIVYQGYFGAPHDGSFVFTASSCFVNGASIWIGEKAFT